MKAGGSHNCGGERVDVPLSLAHGREEQEGGLAVEQRLVEGDGGVKRGALGSREHVRSFHSFIHFISFIPSFIPSFIELHSFHSFIHLFVARLQEALY